MVFRTAEQKDIEQLVTMRVSYLIADWGYLTPEQTAAVESQLPEYLKKHLGTDLMGFVAEEDGQLLGTVLMLVQEKPAGPTALNGKTGTLMNVYTKPECRGQGVGAKLVKMALEDARQKGLCHVDLQATNQGKKLYEYLGFLRQDTHYTPMVFEL